MTDGSGKVLIELKCKIGLRSDHGFGSVTPCDIYLGNDKSTETWDLQRCQSIFTVYFARMSKRFDRQD